MRIRVLFLMLFIAGYSFAQSINNYRAVIIPVKYDFLNLENQYRLQTVTKYNLQQAGFIAFYNNEYVPAEFGDRCSLLYLDVKKESTFFVTKLRVVFKDCNGSVVYQTPLGESREKDFRTAYTEALNEAFKSVTALKYKYNGVPAQVAKTYVPTNPVTPEPAVIAAAATVPAIKEMESIPVKNIEANMADAASLLYAQPTSYGYQLIDSEPKVVMKVYKTSNPASFMASKGNVQGVLVSKDNQWFFEYYQGDKLISEKIAVKF